MASNNLLAGVLHAQTRNSLLTGNELLFAARAVLEILQEREATAVPGDSVGDRILGAALGLDPSLPLVDRSVRLDGRRILLVAGHISGDAAVSARAQSARALGAVHVQAALLSHWTSPIAGCDAVWCIGKNHALSLAAS